MGVKVLITGHTGFKGSWLTMYLRQLGHETYGLSLPALGKSVFNDLSLHEVLTKQHFTDIRNLEDVKRFVCEIQPDVIIHLAAQAFVLEGYRKPLETYEINSIGTLNVIFAALEYKVPNLLVVTTDKVYEPNTLSRPHVETDKLGGSDPYSNSKVIADISTQNLMNRSETSTISIARGGNVIGGGDYGLNRLIPDLYLAMESGGSFDVRFPNAVRPWQHVLDCVSGYWKSVEHAITHRKGEIWNIGPAEISSFSVESVCREFELFFSKKQIWRNSPSSLPETMLLQLDSSKALNCLDWQPRLSVEEALQWTFKWYQEKLRATSMRRFTERQVIDYLGLQ